ncbi:MAG: tetraacyldisaccharide 4'-kinase [Candidatus Aminicenantes bacterium]
MVYSRRRMNFFLFVLSHAYRSVCQAKNLVYRWKLIKPKKAPFPVISIGNITFGGSEKTPLVMKIISLLLDQGYKPAMITRGYKGNWEKSGGVLSDGRNILGRWEDSGDEAFMVAKNIPRAGIFVGRNRLASCYRAKNTGFDVGVLDDGFQHRRIHRDLDIVLYDPSEKNALREPLSSLERAQVVLIKSMDKSTGKKTARSSLIPSSAFEYRVTCRGLFKLGNQAANIPMAKIRGKKVMAFCGIARPQRFYSLLQEQEIHPVSFLKFPDHHPYPQPSLDKIIQTFRRAKADALITTEKDAVKLAPLMAGQKFPACYLKIDVEIEKKFYSTVLSFLQNKDRS